MDDIHVGECVGVGFDPLYVVIEILETCVVVELAQSDNSPFLIRKEQWLKKRASDAKFRKLMSSKRRTGKSVPVPQMPKDFIGFTDSKGNVLS